MDKIRKETFISCSRTRETDNYDDDIDDNDNNDDDNVGILTHTTKKTTHLHYTPLFPFAK